LAGEPPSLSTFGQALADLGITHIKALSPQAKGRIERLWQTFQDRLVIELRLRDVCTMEEANRVLPELIAKHNRQFAVAPQNAEPAYRPLPETPLEHIFARRQYRRISGGQTFSWKGKCYMPKPVPGVPRWEAKSVVEVRVAWMDKCGCGIKGGPGLVWRRRPHRPRRQQRPKKKRRLRPPASPLQSIPGENHSPASSYSVAQHPASLQEDGGCLIGFIPDIFIERTVNLTFSQTLDTPKSKKFFGKSFRRIASGLMNDRRGHTDFQTGWLTGRQRFGPPHGQGARR